MQEESAEHNINTSQLQSQSQQQPQIIEPQPLHRPIKKKEVKTVNQIPLDSNRKHGKKPIKKVINPFDKGQSQSSSAQSKTQNKVIETIGSNRFAELLSKYSGNGNNTKDKGQTEVKSYEKSNSINEKIQSLLKNSNGEKTDCKQSAVIENICEMRKKTLQERDLEKEHNENNDDDEFNSDNLELSDDDNDNNDNTTKVPMINEKVAIDKIIQKKTNSNEEEKEEVGISNEDEAIV